jgi:predicted dehydrogenase
MHPSTISFGFLGAGAIAHGSAKSINNHSHGRVVAVQDPHEGRRSDLCKIFDIPNHYATPEELLADPAVDAVYIAVPNKFHIPLTLQALAAGKHVILEKPFAMSFTEAQTAADAARQAGKVLTLGMNQRFNENSQKFRALAERGAFGEIYHAKAYWLRRSGIPKLGTWFGSKDLAGGGCLYDIGVHVLDLCLYVIGNFEPVSAFGSTYSKFGHRGLGEGGWGKSDKSEMPFEVEDFASGQIRFANGATVSLDVTWARHAEEGDGVEVEIFGTEAGGKVYGNKVFRRDPEFGAFYTINNPQADIRFPHQDRFHNFINHLLGTEELCVTLEQALIVQRILDALAESSRTGRSVDL